MSFGGKVAFFLAFSLFIVVSLPNKYFKFLKKWKK